MSLYLVALQKTLIKNYGEMKIAKPTPGVFKVLKVTGLDKIFKIYHNVESAVRSFD
jgi:anti-anti-sigma regulatory factor